MRILIVFSILAIAGVGSLFWLVHGRPPGYDKTESPRALTQKRPDWMDVPLEPARPLGSDLHKCVSPGHIAYTDQPCPRGQQQKALDPERSRIVTVHGPRAEVQDKPAVQARHDIDVAADGSIGRR